MTRHTPFLMMPARRMTLLALLAIALLIGSVAYPLPAAYGGDPAAEAARAEAPAAIANLTLVKAEIVTYQDSGAWDADIYRVLRPAQAYLLDNLDASGRPAIVFDIDDTILSNYATLKANDFGRVIPILTVAIEMAAFPPIAGAVDLYRLALANGVAVFFISGRGENLREPTIRNLAAAGITGYTGLLLRPDSYTDPSIIPFKAGARRAIVEQGYRILLNVGDQESDLAGGWSERNYKLPNPMYLIP